MLRGMIELSVWERTDLGRGRWSSRKIKRFAITFPFGKHGPTTLAQKLKAAKSEVRKLLKTPR